MRYPLITLAKLMLVRPPKRHLAAECPSYYVRHPARSGVQAMLRVENNGGALQILDCLTVLPQKMPLIGTRTARSQVLSIALALAEEEYQEEVFEYKSGTKRIATPQSISDPLFHPADEAEMVSAVDELLRTCKYRNGSPLLPAFLLDYHERRHFWTPHTLEQGRIAHSDTRKLVWRVLSSWDRWESVDAEWIQRLENVNERFLTMKGEIIEYEKEKLRQMCRRTLGLRRKKDR